MARIRSVHPGLWTDEAFVSVTPLARLLFMGIWTEADDQGVFEWKPVSLKIRLLPMDACDPAALLDELRGQNMLARYEVQGRTYGVIRNFGRYQRPKKPNAVHPLPDELHNFAGHRGTGSDEGGTSSEPGGENGEGGSEPVTHQRRTGSPPSRVAGQKPRGGSPPRGLQDATVPPRGENPPQMEDGDSRSSLRSERPAAERPANSGLFGTDPPPDARDELWTNGLVRLMRLTGRPERQCRSHLGRLLRTARDNCALVTAVLHEAEANRVVDPAAWIERAIEHRAGQEGGASKLDWLRDEIEKGRQP